MSKVVDKLVRDNIPALLKERGIKHSSHVATSDEYESKLFAKAIEEATELAHDRNLEEVADLSEVLTAIMLLKGWTADELEKVQRQKRIAHGAFREKIILESTDE